MAIDTDAIKDAAKERVEKELAELNEKIVKLVAFMYSDKIKSVSNAMRYHMNDQLEYMRRYSAALQERLAIWGMSDEEIHNLGRIC